MPELQKINDRPIASNLNHAFSLGLFILLRTEKNIDNMHNILGLKQF